MKCRSDDLRRLVSTVSLRAKADARQEHSEVMYQTVTAILTPLVESIGPANLLTCLLAATGRIMVREEEPLKSVLKDFIIAGDDVCENLAERLIACYLDDDMDSKQIS